MEAFNASNAPACSAEQTQLRELCWAISHGNNVLVQLGLGRDSTKSAIEGSPKQSKHEVTSKDVQHHLRTFLGHLETLSENHASSKQDAVNIVSNLLDVDVPLKLVTCLDLLDFETMKDVVRCFDTILKVSMMLDASDQIVEYMQNNPQIPELLLKGSGRQDVFSHCAHMLKSLARCPQLIVVLNEHGAARILIGLARHQSFDIASEAFSSLRELLLAQKAVSASCVMTNFTEFFGLYHEMLQGQEYVTQRQALRL
jgi:hypothetical protein